MVRHVVMRLVVGTSQQMTTALETFVQALPENNTVVRGEWKVMACGPVQNGELIVILANDERN